MFDADQSSIVVGTIIGAIGATMTKLVQPPPPAEVEPMVPQPVVLKILEVLEVKESNQSLLQIEQVAGQLERTAEES